MVSIDGWISGTCSITEHVLDRSDFRCAVCEQPWPCLPARVQLGEQYARDPAGLAELMSDYLFEAVRVFLAPPQELHERFVAWTRYPPAHPV